MYHKVRAYIKKNKMIQSGDTIVLGVSGGGDSMTMLHMLCKMREELQITLAVVHVHHGIRGKEADRDALLVENTCKNWNVSCNVYRYHVPELAAEWKMGIEEAGRAVRKEAFAKECEKLGVSLETVKIAVAHNKNDLAETMIYNLSRGSGLRGIGGIQPVNGNTIRPLLCLERKEIDKYLEIEAIPYVTDSTNLEVDYTRNKIRHHIIPILEQEINTQAIQHMAEAAEKIMSADGYLCCVGEKLAEKYRNGEMSYVLTEAFFAEEEIVKQYAVLSMLENIAGKRKNLTQIHVQQVMDSVAFQTGKYICLPYNIVVRKEYGHTIIERKMYDVEKQVHNCEVMWEIGEESGIYYPQDDFCVKVFSYNNQKICEKKYTKWFDYDKIQKNMSVRNRQPGDYIVIDKAGKKKKLTRYMIDEKIPQEDRDTVLLLASGSEIIWIIGGRISENYKITKESKRILEVRYQGGNGNVRED